MQKYVVGKKYIEELYGRRDVEEEEKFIEQMRKQGMLSQGQQNLQRNLQVHCPNFKLNSGKAKAVDGTLAELLKNLEKKEEEQLFKEIKS